MFVLLVINVEMSASPSFFMTLSQGLRGRSPQDTALADADEAFRAMFGIGTVVCANLWRACAWHGKVKPIHLLWGLMFLKTYATQAVLVAIAGCTKKTFRKWTWKVVKSMAYHANYVVSLCACLRYYS